MKFIKENWSYLLIFIAFTILAINFPLTSTDLEWVNIANKLEIKNFYSIASGKLISSAILLLITKFKILKVITYGIITTCMFVLMKNIVNKKNRTLMYIGVFLFLLLGNQYLNSGYVWNTGFVYNFISSIFILIFLNLYIKNSMNKMNTALLFLLGVSASLITPYTSIILLILSILEIFYRKKNILSTIPNSIRLLGMLFGTSIMCYYLYKNKDIIMTSNFSKNLLHEIIPKLYDTNFLVILILISFLLFFCIKIYLRGNTKKRIYTGISMGIITMFALTYLLSTNHILNYVAFILFTGTSIFILLNTNNSIFFKKKIIAYYTIKITFIIVSMFIPNLTHGDLLLPLIVDVLIILEIINYVFPNNFLENVWIIVMILMLGANIYLYRDVNEKHISMNYYIKNHLECAMYDFAIPSKYNTPYLYRILPETPDEIINYLEYYNIESNYIFRVYFNE